MDTDFKESLCLVVGEKAGCGGKRPVRKLPQWSRRERAVAGSPELELQRRWGVVDFVHSP